MVRFQSVGPENIEAIHRHLRNGGRVMVAGGWKPLLLNHPAQISADGQGYRVPAGPRSKSTVYAFNHQVVWY